MYFESYSKKPEKKTPAMRNGFDFGIGPDGPMPPSGETMLTSSPRKSGRFYASSRP
jgi:hypothetical protein